ncbi:small heat shock protein [Coprinopsis cinerea okayama7|uniref:Small heat shock protein n=1 Tax=Coprinopsis cinerea (strain Okayama-7 / 130 / ATCC MYA-4618 / FGSC 9003) TaxID=240176 RepID=A8N559_COPC7|nr:small heat shock protein [Coprinopsis cinerea okayama7\|eukprot:XP_001829977.1 small heat shock protein [Coprinopsis cinerea okayama7\
MSNVFFYEPFYDFDRFFDEAFGGQRVPSVGRQIQSRVAEEDGAVRHFKPRMDLHEDSEKNLVTASFELPGLKKEDVSIDVHNGRLTVSAETKASSEFEENGYAVRERRFGKLLRTLQLPTGLKEEDIKASMENGVLTVTFPKSSPELAPRKIAIS